MAATMAVGAPLKIAAPAKINLYLRVLGRRVDGYHDLESRMQKIALFDWLTISLRATSGVSLAVSGGQLAELPGDATNLVWRAAAAFFAACGLTDTIGADIVLEKNIPLAAGLGGGSSDAASTLMALNRLCGSPLTDSSLGRLGLSLGADVPFFLFPAPAAMAGGVGEILRPTPALTGYRLVLVNPGFAVSTKEVFSRLPLTAKAKKIKRTSPADAERFDVADLANDLEVVTAAMHPEIARIKERLLSLGAAGALMSGSGATVFGLFSTRNFSGSFARVENNLRQEFGPLVFVTNTLTGA